MKNLLLLPILLFSSFILSQNKVASFKGKNDRIELETTFNKNMGTYNGFTVELWVNINNTQTNSAPQLFAFVDTDQKNNVNDIAIPLSVGFNLDNELTIIANGKHHKVKKGNDSLELKNTEIILPNNEWIFLSITFNNIDNKIDIYIDGSHQKTITDLDIKNIDYNSVTKLFIADFSSSSHNSEKKIQFGNYAGKMDEFKIYNYAKTELEVQNNLCSEETLENEKLLAYLKFNSKLEIKKNSSKYITKSITKGNPIGKDGEYYCTSYDGGDYGIGVEPQPTILVIYNGENIYDYTNDSQFKKVIIQTGGSLTIAESGKLNITDELIVNGTLTVKEGAELNLHTAFITNNGEITLESSASLYQGYFDEDTQLCTNKLNIENGIWNVKRKSAYIANDTRYSFWSTPVYGSKAGEAFEGTNTSRLYRWKCDTQGWRNLELDEILYPGDGYTIFGKEGESGIQERTFTGDSIANGEIKVKIERNEEDAYCIIGNPYPSAIDWIKVAEKNPNIINGTAYVWIQNEDLSTEGTNYDDYTMINASGETFAGNAGIEPSRYISSSQAFAVEMKTTGNITFNNCMRVNGYNQKFFKKEQNTDKKLWLSLSNNNNSSQILINFNENATDGFDRMYDGKQISESKTRLYTIVNDSIKLTIEGRDDNFLDEKIKLCYDIKEEGESVFELNKVENFENVDIFLFDKHTNITTNLKNNNYKYTSNSNENLEDRFELSFSSKSNLLDVKNEIKTELRIYNYQNEIKIELNNTEILDVEIINIAGAKIPSKYNNSSKTLKHNGLKKGMYIIRIKTDNKVLAKAIII